MEMQTKQKLLNAIGNLYENAKDSKLENAYFDHNQEDLQTLSGYFKTTPSQSFFIALIFALNYRGNRVSLNDLIKYLDCNPMKILEFSEDFDELANRGILEKENNFRHSKLVGSSEEYTIHKMISEAMLQNKPCPETGPKKATDIVGLLEDIHQLYDQCDDRVIDCQQLFHKTEKILDKNEQYPLIKKIKQFNYDISDQYLLLHLIWETLNGDESILVNRTLEGVYYNPSARFAYMQDFLHGNNKLIKNDWIETFETEFFDNTEMKLTEKSQDLLHECGLKLFKKEKKKENVFSPADIPLRKLVFNDRETQQLALLKNLLDEKNFSETQKRLNNKNLPTGIAVLFHGVPGTGKTETVKQLARKTNRELMKVDISQSKSMWFGESEKIVKRIFTDYKNFAKKCKQTPILLFNEADAIISKRKEVGDSNTAQTQNAIQNIILEELENFEGILMATTNLVSNLDTAFERRFLFKIKFRKPEAAVKAQIWNIKLPQLSEADCALLAQEFDFSGGQIDNIIRKSEIHEIIHGTPIDVKTIYGFCQEESLSDTPRSSIGFSQT